MLARKGGRGSVVAMGGGSKGGSKGAFLRGGGGDRPSAAALTDFRRQAAGAGSDSDKEARARLQASRPESPSRAP